jgi:1-acyl-sn-glycerol-3-phosphate acyltransferase
MDTTFRIVAATFSMYVVTHLFAIFFLPYAIAASYLDPGRMPALKRIFMRVLFAIVGEKLSVSGTDNVETNHKYVIISNYPSFYAGFALIGTFPSARIVAHAFLQRVPLVGQMLRRVGAVFVRPGRKGLGRAAIDTSLSEKSDHRGIIILPEGGRTPDGEIKRFRRGFIRILRQTEFDLLPITLNGLYQLKPVRRFHVDSSAELEMIIHPPVTQATLEQMTDDQVLRTAHEIVCSDYRP